MSVNFDDIKEQLGYIEDNVPDDAEGLSVTLGNKDINKRLLDVEDVISDLLSWQIETQNYINYANDIMDSLFNMIQILSDSVYTNDLEDETEYDNAQEAKEESEESGAS